MNLFPDERSNRTTTSPGAADASKPGCLGASLPGLLAGWFLISITIAQILFFALEQVAVEADAGAGGWRWLVALFFAFSILVAAAAAWRTASAPQASAFYAASLLAGIFVLALVPARLVGITQAHTVALLQIAGMLAFLALAGRLPARASFPGALWLALHVAAFIGIPWVLWGALGSPLDVLLNLVVALLFGLSASRVLRSLFAAGGHAAGGQQFFRDGFRAWLLLLVMSTALAVVGVQGLISLTVPALGWLAAAISRRGRDPAEEEAEPGGALAVLLGLAAFWPLAFVDPDEIAVALNFGLTQLEQWANLAAFASLAIGLLAGLAVRNGLPHFNSRGLRLAATLLPWLVAGGLYLAAGQPGFHGDRLFVIMSEQAELSEVARIQPYGERRAAAYRLLVDQSADSQAGIRSDLERWGIRYRSFYLQNALEVNGGPLVRWWLASRPDVARVLDSPRLRPLPADLPVSTGSAAPPTGTPWNLQMIGADRVWQTYRVRGAGIVIGQSDSGVQGNHPELADSYRGRDGQHDYHWYDPWNGTGAPVDASGHGTHTLAIAAGNRVGVAPDADWIGCVNLARNLGNPADYLACLEFLLAPFPLDGDPQQDGRPALGAHILNNSWGCPPVEGCDPDALLPAVRALRAAGVFVVASAGNEGDGGCGSVAAPLSLYAEVYSVGAVDQSGDLAPFSSTGPVQVDGSLRVKPDIAAPGVAVLSAYPGSTYAPASGTSMAGPHVAGVVALMWSANPTLIGDIDLTTQILNETAAPYEGWLPDCAGPARPNYAAGYGILNAYEAVRRALGE